MKKASHTVYYSCHEKFHIFGTGFVVGKRAAQLIIGFKPVDHRICYIRMKGKFYNYSLWSVHAPTEPSEEEDKDAFYGALEQSLDQAPRADIKIVIGDFNAQVGKEQVYAPTIGANSLHNETNDNGRRMIGLAASRGLVVGSTLFRHKRIHLATWKSNDGITTNQIDHILMSSRHISGLQDVRTYRGANIDSDHYLVLAKVKARISTVRNLRGRAQPKPNVEKLKDPEIRTQFADTMDQKLRSTPVEGNIDEQWEA